jgi:hypothetical protein
MSDSEPRVGADPSSSLAEFGTSASPPESAVERDAGAPTAQRPGLLRMMFSGVGRRSRVGADLASSLQPRIEARYGPAIEGSGSTAVNDPNHPEFAAGLAGEAFPDVEVSKEGHLILFSRLRELGTDHSDPSAQRAAGTARLFAHTLAAVTGGDPDRAQNALVHWGYGDSNAHDEASADVFAARCALSVTETGRRALGSVDRAHGAGDASAALATPEAEQAKMIRLCACNALRYHFVPFGSQSSPPASEEQAVEWAKQIVQLSETPDDPEHPDPKRAQLLEHNLIAARALLGVSAAEPSNEERAAILMLRSGELRTSSQTFMSTRMNRMLGRAGDKPSWWSRVRGRETMPVNEQRILDALSLSAIDRLTPQLENALRTTLENAQGNAPEQVREDSMRIAARMAALNVMADRIARKSWREPIKLGRHALGKVTEKTARLLGADERELVREDGWPDIVDECSILDSNKIGEWAHAHVESGELEKCGFDAAIHGLDGMQDGFSMSRGGGLKSLMLAMPAGGRVVFTSAGVRGLNFPLTGAATKPGVSNVVPVPIVFPTVAAAKGREANFAMSCEETPKGACVCLEVSTTDRRSLTAALAVAARSEIGPFRAYAVYEAGKRAEQSTDNGAIIRIEADTLEAAKEKAGLVMDALMGSAAPEAAPMGSVGKTAATISDRLVDHAYRDEAVTVQRISRTADTGATFHNFSALAGVNLPASRWVGAGPDVGRSRGYTEEQGTAGPYEVIRGEVDVRRTLRTDLAVGNPAGPGGTLGTIDGSVVSGGMGALFYTEYGPKKSSVNFGIPVLCIPTAGTHLSAFRQFTIDEATYRKWAANADGTALPELPPGLEELPPDSPVARGLRQISVRQYLTPDKAEQLTSLQHAATASNCVSAAMSSRTQAAIEQFRGEVSAILNDTDEKSWGEVHVLDQHGVTFSKHHSLKPYIAVVQTTRETRVVL